jgi:cytochrome c biogenesis protein CcdA/thiol-disulfide isomerase/thioredoxin
VFAGGALTIFSPCILPVLPFVFTRSGQRFATHGLPMLLGMAVTFALIASLAAVGGGWAVRLNETGRTLSLIALSAFAATLLSRRLAEQLSRPFVALGNRLLPSGPNGLEQGVLSSLLIGVATGLLWAPCAGPILGLVLTGAALSGPTAHTSLLLLLYAAGAACSLAVALLAGGRVFAALKRSLGAGEWIRRALGIAVLLAVAGIALKLDETVLARWSLSSTSRLEQALLGHLTPTSREGTGARLSTAPAAAAMSASPAGSALPVEGTIPALSGATGWINSPPLDAQALRGKVVLIDFWTYSCINCLRTLPYIRSWYERYKDHGLVVIGVHAPEFAFEKDPANVRRAVADLHIEYPVALDDQYAIWRGFDNQYWPAHYFIDPQGRIRGHHFGEGDYEESERTLRALLTEAGHTDLPAEGAPDVPRSGVEAAADLEHDASPETYIGYRRAQHFVSPGGFAQDRLKLYAFPPALEADQWALAGRWLDQRERAVLKSPGGAIAFRFTARDLHLVLGPGEDGRPVRFRVRLDGAAPGPNHGVDTDEQGDGVVREQRLYQLIRQGAPVESHTFTIEFLDPEVQAYSFTFG